jgi:nucleotide-binding universal stress UspA family protein
MRVFRRSQSPDSEAARFPPGRSEEAVIGVPAHRDAGPILVAVDSQPHSWDALEWAAAEAAARQCSLRILQAFHWSPTAVDLGGMSVNAWDAGAEEVAERIATKAACHARMVAPGLKVTTLVREGGMVEVVLREARSDALIVLGRGGGGGRMRSLTRSVSWQVARHAACPVTIVGLAKLASTGPSMGRVVVGLESGGDPRLPLGFAFRAAQRRGVGVTVVGALSPRDPSGHSAQDNELDGAAFGGRLILEDAVQCFRGAFPAVDVQERLVTVPIGSALVAESAAAALVVLSAQLRGRLRGPLSNAAVRSVLRSVCSPVAVLRTPPAGRRPCSQTSSAPGDSR